MDFKNLNNLRIDVPFELEQNVFTQLYYSKVLNFNMELQLKSKNIENGIEQLQRVEAGDGNELRLLRLPALNLEALWLAGSDGMDGKYYLVRHFEDREGVLDQKEFNALVQRLKAAADQQDDTMGA